MMAKSDYFRIIMKDISIILLLYTKFVLLLPQI